MNETILECFRKELKDITTSFNEATHGTILLGHNETENTDKEFFSTAGFRGIFDLLKVGQDNREKVRLMSIDDAIKERYYCPILSSKENNQETGCFLANHIAKHMFDVGISYLYEALKSTKEKTVLDHTSSPFKEVDLYKHGVFSSSPYLWLAHSYIHSLLMTKSMKMYLRLPPKILFSFKDGGFIADMLTKTLIFRDKDFLMSSNDGENNKYSLVGLYGGAVAVFVDNFSVKNNTIPLLYWDQRVAIRGFTHQGGWQPKTNEAKDFAGFIIETGAVSDKSC